MNQSCQYIYIYYIFIIHIYIYIYRFRFMVHGSWIEITQKVSCSSEDLRTVPIPIRRVWLVLDKYSSNKPDSTTVDSGLLYYI